MIHILLSRVAEDLVSQMMLYAGNNYNISSKMDKFLFKFKRKFFIVKGEQIRILT